MNRVMRLAVQVIISSLALGLAGCQGSGGGSSPDPGDPPLAVNTPPAANAGSDQVVAPGATVNLSGAGSTDANGSISTYAWTQIAGQAVALAAAGSATPSFTAPATAGALTFQLTVTDNGGASHSDSITVTVNAIPVVNAGADQTVSAGAAVSLAGSATDGDGAIAGFTWAQTSGAAVTLSNANTAAATFTAPAVTATLTFTLTATDDHGATHADSVTVNVTANDPQPVTPPAIGRHPNDARSREHGSAMFFVAASGEALTFEWRRASGVVVKTGPDPFLLRTDLTLADDGSCFYVVISNDLGTETSEQGCVTVDEIEWVLDPSDDPDSADDAAYAQTFGDSLMKIAQRVTGPFTAVTDNATTVNFPIQFGPPSSCSVGSYHGATLDGVLLTAPSQARPLGRHTISESWDDCWRTSDDPDPQDGAYLVEYDFPQTWGVGTVTIHVSQRHFNGTIRATLIGNVAGGQRSDDIEIVVGDNFSAGELRARSDQSFTIERRYAEDGVAVDEVLLDLDVALGAFDANGPAGTLFVRQGGEFRLRQDVAQGNVFTSDGVMVVGLETWVLAALEPAGASTGWNFAMLMPEQCPEGYVCVDPPMP